MRIRNDGLGSIDIFFGERRSGKQLQSLMKEYRYLEQEIVDLKKELIEEKKLCKEKDKKIEKLEVLVELLHYGITLNREQEELLDSILFGSDKE